MKKINPLAALSLYSLYQFLHLFIDKTVKIQMQSGVSKTTNHPCQKSSRISRFFYVKILYSPVKQHDT